jgi:hypothetical protein
MRRADLAGLGCLEEQEQALQERARLLDRWEAP